MSGRTLVLDWSLDGPVGAVFLVLILCLGKLYWAAASCGRRRDRRGRRWPHRRTVCFLSALVILCVDLYSGIGTQADRQLSAHMVEHMVMWVIVAPLLAASAPVRLAFYTLGHDGRQRLARCLHSRPVSAVTGPVGSTALFSAILLISHVPAVYGLTLSNDYAHEGEHALYLLAAVLMWAPLIGVDPLPHRPGPGAQAVGMFACMIPMALIALWLATAPAAVYGHYVVALGPSALRDQRLAAVIMMAAGPPAVGISAVIGAVQRQRRRQRPVEERRPARSFPAAG